jgi:hypothetical protein
LRDSGGRAGGRDTRHIHVLTRQPNESMGADPLRHEPAMRTHRAILAAAIAALCRWGAAAFARVTLHSSGVDWIVDVGPVTGTGLFVGSAVYVDHAGFDDVMVGHRDHDGAYGAPRPAWRLHRPGPWMGPTRAPSSIRPARRVT